MEKALEMNSKDISLGMPDIGWIDVNFMNDIGDMYRFFGCRITGGNDKEGFPMMQGVLINHRVRLLLSKGMLVQL